MKTLNEVIKAVHHCGLISGFDDYYKYDGGCPYEDCSKCEKKRMLGKDIIKYLNEYKRISAKLEKIAIGNVEDTLSKLDNSALTWDELRQMEGKPIWVEVDYHNPEETYKYWTIVKYFDSNEGGDMVFTGTGFYHKDLLGIDWRAYRKEKNETD